MIDIDCACLTDRKFKPEVNITIPRCSACGDPLSDQEIGQIDKKYCVFCLDFPIRPQHHPGWKILYWKIFKNFDYQIWILKIKLRDVVESSERFKELNLRHDRLLQEHYDDLFPKQYSEILNPFQKDYHDTNDKIDDLRYLARNAYNNCLGKFGTSISDQAPTIRTVSFVDKVIMVRDLKIELENLIQGFKYEETHDYKRKNA